MSHRLPGFSRMETGALWSAIDANEQQTIAAAIKSKDIPIICSEKRGLLERLCDLWSTGPTYLKRAAQEIDPIERMKNVLAFAISGLHTCVK